MAVAFGGGTMGCPSRVSNGDLRNKRLVDVESRGCDFLAQPSDLADFLEKRNGSGFVAIDTYAG